MSDELLSLRTLMEEHIKEAVIMRMGVKLPNELASMTDLMDALLDARRRLDRIEEILGSTLRWKASTNQVWTACKVELENAWDEAATKNRAAAARDEYSSARERAASVNLAVLDLRRAERKAEQDAKLCDETVEYIRLRYHGLAGYRQDLIALVKARQFETSLDR